jgi:hypothetical protein
MSFLLCINFLWVCLSDLCSSMIILENSQTDSSHFIFLFQNCILYDFTYACKKTLLRFDRNCVTLYVNFGRLDIFLLCWIFSSMNMVYFSIYLDLLWFLSSAFCNIHCTNPVPVLLDSHISISFSVYFWTIINGIIFLISAFMFHC